MIARLDPKHDSKHFQISAVGQSCRIMFYLGQGGCGIVHFSYPIDGEVQPGFALVALGLIMRFEQQGREPQVKS